MQQQLRGALRGWRRRAASHRLRRRQLQLAAAHDRMRTAHRPLHRWRVLAAAMRDRDAVAWRQRRRWLLLGHLARWARRCLAARGAAHVRSERTLLTDALAALGSDDARGALGVLSFSRPACNARPDVQNTVQPSMGVREVPAQGPGKPLKAGGRRRCRCRAGARCAFNHTRFCVMLRWSAYIGCRLCSCRHRGSSHRARRRRSSWAALRLARRGGRRRPSR